MALRAIESLLRLKGPGIYPGIKKQPETLSRLTAAHP
jgi:hypothetical protein